MIRENADSVSWSVGRGRTLGPAPFFVIGILNVTPDSFYDGGKSAQTEAAVRNGLRLLTEGADILDIGGESTRPFSDSVLSDEELRRVVPVAKEILRQNPAAVLSIDTSKADVARQCLDAGALIINDVSGFDVDPALLDVVAQCKPGYVLMHSLGRPETMQDAPKYTDVIAEICAFFDAKLNLLLKAGVPESNIVLDPGIGFGKTLAHNLEILKNMDRFHVFGRPLYMGLSNKSLWKGLLGRDGHERNAATLAATAVLLGKNVRIHRVHEVRAARDALTVAHVLGCDSLTQGATGC